MAMRDLVMGGGACVVPGGDGASSSSNPLGGLADSLLGGASKTQERIRELPGLAGPGQSADLGGRPLTYLPGSEFENEFDQRASAQNSQFLQRFGSKFSDAWGDAVNGHMMPPVAHHDREQEAAFRNFEALYPGMDSAGRPPLALDAPPQRVLSGFFQSFLDSSRMDGPFNAVRLPELGLSEADKRRIRDRSSIMGRHFFADKGDEYVNARVNALLQSLDIDNNLKFREPMGGRHPEMEGYWNEVIGARPGGRPLPDQWAEDFHQHHRIPEPGGWAQEFEAQHNGESWGDQFGEHQQQMAARGQFRNGEMNNMAALEQTRSLVNTLAQNQDPKFQNSKFLQFVSKMSRGELIVEDNQVKPGVTNDWANEFQQQHLPPGDQWASEFMGEHQHRGDRWGDEFARRHQEAPSTSDDWVNDFSRLHVQDWADEYAEQVAKNPYGDGSHESWLDSYDKFVGEQMTDLPNRTASSKFVYVFADQNPYVGHPNPLKEGQELFRRGLLSEAVLALEAELLKNPENSEGWRLLGITHAENDDDKQAIASMVRARDADPTNLEVLLALGVGHTNELEQAEALRYLGGWLQNHPQYSKFVQQDVNSLSHSQVTQMVNEAALVAPGDGDVHTVLGVLYNLSREYDRAIQSFQRALELKPRDYSLWNKLGATQANSARSADAIYAYQQALDLKPNYVRAWSNMGIGYANQGRYEESIRYYVRALGMNPKADNVWDYLKISLSSCAARWDMMEACERRELEPLQKEYPL
ncbi:peroxin-5 [Marchantia polymorpha subsp. ruderalis]|uniref:Uncharacterized protein n=1 Tax=Marchantia polymorpha TaxID=3197 RepID=A0A2R6WR48_MARPO|nr:hypothetical protein MARPO_0064s0022 [Marchantia polymorpha]PTQ36333.1 hypothetical protein MARPO_0064s0022 [Marchantia polymorpha]BBN18341.1 hypothetical protein Mp_8g01780 [Marchantia polymorpha subsp. ruderalis]BBN18342.1 hypothetical protein Mp_8g01780 [Marchantia polymorpha subsp. ruderalis]|eukprot:PTQ36331.1 hypothetical protein MARPO_0064s0022 [Marchantia polymorpha]